MNNEAEGTIHLIMDEQQITDTFKKRVLVLSITDGPYTQLVPIEFVQDRVDILDKFKPNDAVTVSYNLRGREHGGKFYSSIQGWKCRKTETVQAEKEAIPENNPPTDSPGDLPF